MKRENLFNIALVLISSLVAFGVVEFGYRVFLQWEERSRFRPQTEFFVYNSSIWRFDAQIGYVYAPDARMDWAFLRDGVPRRCGSFTTGRFGSPGAGPAFASLADAELVVLGDSFTAFVHDNATWPDLLGRRLEQELGREVRLVNLSMDGYGVLQMVDQAARLVQDGIRPKAFVIALIGPDLTRIRSWRVTSGTPDAPQVFTSYLPSTAVSPATHVRTGHINPLATNDWCYPAVASGNSDATSQAIVNGFEAERRQDSEFFGKAVRLFSVADCYLCRLAFAGSPFPKEISFPKFDLRRYQDDPTFRRNMGSLRESGSRVILIYLPWEPELRHGKKQLNATEVSLLESLQREVDEQVDLTPEAPMGDRAVELTLLPHDAHPSAQGIQFYAEQAFQRGRAIWTVLLGERQPPP